MSMIGWLEALTQPQAQALVASPALASDLARVVSADYLAARLEAVRRSLPAGLPAPPAGTEAQSALMRDYRLKIEEARARVAALGPLDDCLCLEKSWHLLHFLFTGHAGAEAAPGNQLLTGLAVGGDVGYGPPRLHDAAAVATFARFLATQAVDVLEARVDARAYADAQIYPQVLGADPEEVKQQLSYDVETYFPLLAEYVQRAAAGGRSLLVWLS